MRLTSLHESKRTRKRLVASVAVTLALGVATPVPAHADKLHQRQKAAHHAVQKMLSRVDDASSQVVATTKRLHAAQAALKQSRASLTQAWRDLRAAQAKDAQMAAQLQAAQARLATAQAALAAGRVKVDQQHQFVGDLVVSNYEGGDPQLLGLSQMLKAQDPADIIRQTEAMSVAMSDQSNAYSDLLQAQSALKQHEADVASATAEVSQERADAAAHLVETGVLKNNALQARDRFHTQWANQKAARAAAIAARRADVKKLRRAKRQEASVHALIMKRARLAAMRKGFGYNGPTSGFLIRPVPGPITSPFGWRIHPIYHYWGLHDGDDFSAYCGEPLKAAGTGRVIAEYYSDVWGNRLYLNLGEVNGKNITVIYNHMSGYKVHTGDVVAGGDTVGYVGTTGWSTGCHLHFTVDVNGSPVDPMTMIAH